ncbi:MAG: phosphoribosylamine--glycine ligase [Anaerolineaceae bacterium]|nr:phosphoribosylamine--glycine ligase [Anaerolineaceae bacterium]
MNILIVGSGGREHALAWSIAQSPRLTRLFIAPGNAGTSSIGENVAVEVEDIPKIADFCESKKIDLVIVGPEASLAAGLVDELHFRKIAAFGPTQLAAQIEASKSFAKAFMQRHAIPTARYASFQTADDAYAYLDQAVYPVVIKASGLAAGKGVFLPQTIEEAKEAVRIIMEEQSFGSAGDEIIIEENLEGEEVSLLAFSDGYTIRSMPPAQDHKRLLDNDQGPNTGGMGAYCSNKICGDEMVRLIEKTILQPVIDGMREEGRPFVGVLFAGLMMTQDGPKVLEFNCRFGDPETQVILPLLRTDLISLAEACVNGKLNELTLEWEDEAAVTIVLASGGYPGKYKTGIPIDGLDNQDKDVLLFHAGTRLVNGKVVSAGGRVLNVTSVGKSIKQAVDTAYQALGKISFDGMVYRQDIAHRALKLSAPEGNQSAYADSGVSIDTGNLAVSMMREAVKSTYNPAVLAGIGSFGGLYDADLLKGKKHPVLVASTDGVGTKVSLAAAAGKVESIGKDIVNHCVNDILVQGAIPLFFLDYFACSKLDPKIVSSVVSGISTACREANCVLLGGETAEMPGVYKIGEFDVAGTIVGIVEKEQILPRDDVAAGDLLVGLASSGPHTNGYSLIRKIFAGADMEKPVPGTNLPLISLLLEPHRSFLALLKNLLEANQSPIKALAHLTGGGFVENIPRVLPENMRAVIHTGSWPIPALFKFIQEQGSIAKAEMYRVFNMGIGMVVVVHPSHLKTIQDAIPEQIWVIGEIASGKKGVVIL